MSEKKNVAVVLANLGGPEKMDDIQPFREAFFTGVIKLGLRNPLYNIGLGKANLSLPDWLNNRLAPKIAGKIADRQLHEAQEGYRDLYNMWQRRDFEAEGLEHLKNSFELGGSPIHASTRKQVDDTVAELNKNYGENTEFTPFVAMAYWPRNSNLEAAQTIAKGNYDEVVWVTAYPQYSITTTGDAKAAWQDAAKQAGLTTKTQYVESYQVAAGFIDAHVERIEEALANMTAKGKKKDDIMLVFSPHGLPQRFIDDGDPNSEQVAETVQAIADKMGLAAKNVTISYQSKATREPWTEPNTEDVVERLGKTQTPTLIVPVAFIGDHIETTVELGDEYLEVYEEAGGRKEDYFVATAIENHPAFVQSLAEQVAQTLAVTRTESVEQSAAEEAELALAHQHDIPPVSEQKASNVHKIAPRGAIEKRNAITPKEIDENGINRETGSGLGK